MHRNLAMVTFTWGFGTEAPRDVLPEIVNRVAVFVEREFAGTVSELLELNVLLAGIRPRCPHCGYRIWYHVDEVAQVVGARDRVERRVRESDRHAADHRPLSAAAVHSPATGDI